MSIDVPIAQVNFIVKSLFHAMPSTAARILYLGLMLSFPKCYGIDVQLGGNSCAFKRLDMLSCLWGCCCGRISLIYALLIVFLISNNILDALLEMLHLRFWNSNFYSHSRGANYTLLKIIKIHWEISTRIHCEITKVTKKHNNHSKNHWTITEITGKSQRWLKVTNITKKSHKKHRIITKITKNHMIIRRKILVHLFL